MNSENTNNNNDLDPSAATEANKPSQEEIVKLELDEEKKKYLYLYAEFDTFKKRVIKERSELIKFGTEPLIREMLMVVDNLERALEHTTDTSALVTGIKMVVQQFADTLMKFGVQKIATEKAKFDPEKHEAVGQEPVDSPELDGCIVKEFQKGYLLHGRLLRPAKVSVGTVSPASSGNT